MRFSARLKIASFRRFFVRISLISEKQHVIYDKTTRCSRNYKGLFSDYVPRNLFFFPRDFENVRRNLFSSEKFGEMSENDEKRLRIRARFVGGMILNLRGKH